MKQKNHILFGLVASLAVIILFVGQYLMGISLTNKLLGWMPTVIVVVAVVAGCINFSKINDADVSFGEVFGNGFRTTAIITVVCIVFFAIFNLLVPEFKEQIIQAQLEAAAQKGANMEQMEQNMEMTRNYFMVFMIAGSLFMYVITGTLASLLGAAIAKKKK
ncbi:DUF4199 family protein [Chitinophaga lutea]